MADVVAGRHRLAQFLAVVVDIAEDEMGGPAGELLDDLDRADVATVDDLLHLAAFQHLDGLTREDHLPVRITHHADSHRRFSLPAVTSVRRAISTRRRKIRLIRLGSSAISYTRKTGSLRLCSSRSDRIEGDHGPTSNHCRDRDPAGPGGALALWFWRTMPPYALYPVPGMAGICVNLTVNRLLWRTTVSGPLPIGPDQGAVIVCNHRSGIDPLLIQMATERVVHWMVAGEYFELSNHGSLSSTRWGAFRWAGAASTRPPPSRPFAWLKKESSSDCFPRAASTPPTICFCPAGPERH